MAQKSDNFLMDAINKPKSDRPRLSYLDGLRFGFGFFTAGLIICLILGLLTWGAIFLMQML